MLSSARILAAFTSRILACYCFSVVVVAMSLAFSQITRTIVPITMLPLSLAVKHLGLANLWIARTVQPLLKLGKTGEARRRAIAGRRELDKQPAVPVKDVESEGKLGALNGTTQTSKESRKPRRSLTLSMAMDGAKKQRRPEENVNEKV